MLGDDHNPPRDPGGELMDADDIRARVKEWWNERFYDPYYDEVTEYDSPRASEDDGCDEPAEDDEADLRASECDGGDEPAEDDEADPRV
eukprot:SAG11_NODE_8742_length_980_cov_17.282633_1_plen_88_part_10